MDEVSAARRVAASLGASGPLLTDLGKRFAAAGFELALVGGPVRDAVRTGSLADVPDLDLTTSAPPLEAARLLASGASAQWDVGIRFGTVGARFGDRVVEVTTYRAEAYDHDSRKPEVTFGTSLADDLVRRDFTVNAMALTLPDLRFVDLHDGLADLEAGVLRTPGTPQESFSDDPLRMMRAARFVSQLGFSIAPQVHAAMVDMAERITIVSAERVREELVKLVMGAHPRAGLDVLVETGLAARVLPELPALRLEIDEHHRHKDVYDHSLTVLEQAIDLETSHDPASGPDLVLRLAALLHDIGKPKTRRHEAGGGVSFHHHEVVGAKLTAKRLKALKFSGEIVDEVTELVGLHLRFHGYGGGEWTDSAVRRYVRDAGPQLTRLHKLTRADCTTRNRRRAAALAATYDDLEARIARLRVEEEIDAIRPDLDGTEIMEILGIAPGREVGEAYRFLLDLRLDRGPLGADLAREALLAWWAARPTR